MFPQSIRSTQLDTPYLQQSRKKKTRFDCLLFEKKYYKARAQTFSRGQHCWSSMQTGATLLRYASPVTEQQKCYDLLDQKFDRFQTVRNKCQILLWFHANGRNKSQHCGPKNVGCCWPTMLRPFAWAFALERFMSLISKQGSVGFFESMLFIQQNVLIIIENCIRLFKILLYLHTQFGV